MIQCTRRSDLCVTDLQRYRQADISMLVGMLDAFIDNAQQY